MPISHPISFLRCQRKRRFRIQPMSLWLLLFAIIETMILWLLCSTRCVIVTRVFLWGATAVSNIFEQCPGPRWIQFSSSTILFLLLDGAVASLCIIFATHLQVMTRLIGSSVWASNTGRVWRKVVGIGVWVLPNCSMLTSTRVDVGMAIEDICRAINPRRRTATVMIYCMYYHVCFSSHPAFALTGCTSLAHPLS